MTFVAWWRRVYVSSGVNHAVWSVFWVWNLARMWVSLSSLLNFKTWFLKLPSVIIYDNVCSLHWYCLYSKPQFLKKIPAFLWILFNEKDMYRLLSWIQSRCITMSIKYSLMSNGVQRIKGQLSYMNIDNFSFHLSVFLELRYSKWTTTVIFVTYSICSS